VSGRPVWCGVLREELSERRSVRILFVVAGRAAARSSGGVNIALVTETFPPEINGVAMTYGVLARELVRHGNAVTVYRPVRREPWLTQGPGVYREQGMPGMPIPGYPQLRMGLPSGKRLQRLWTEARPDVVHVATEGPLGVSAVNAARALGIPVTSSFHTNFHLYARHYGFGVLERVVLWWLRWLHNRTARTFVPTPEVKGQLEAKGFHNLSLLSRGVDIEKFNPRNRCEALRRSWGAGSHDCVVLHVGRLAPEKNYALLLEIYARMRAANSSCRFVLVGEGPLQPTLSRAEPPCVFAGAVPHEQIGRYFASADVYIHASRSETFGNVVLEGLASGLAFAGFDYASAAQFVRHGQNGLLAPLEQEESLKRAAEEIAAEAPLRQRLGQGAREAVLQQSWEAVAGKFLSDLEAVVAPGA
jgi:glycosyltransferase involved in cell wall biosynthesis